MINKWVQKPYKILKLSSHLLPFRQSSDLHLADRIGLLNSALLPALATPSSWGQIGSRVTSCPGLPRPALVPTLKILHPGKHLGPWQTRIAGHLLRSLCWPITEQPISEPTSPISGLYSYLRGTSYCNKSWRLVSPSLRHLLFQGGNHSQSV